MSRNTATQEQTGISEDFLFEEGRRSGAAYAGRAPYRELVLLEKLVNNFGTNFSRVEIASIMLAREACETESLDLDSRSWIADNLSWGFQGEESYVRGFLEGAFDGMESETNVARLQGEKAALEETLFEEGRSDGRAYGKRAPYRELRSVEKFVQSSGTDFAGSEITSVMLACQVGETERLDQDSTSWIEDNLSEHWHSEESYVRGFIDGALDVMSGEVEIEKD